MRRYYVLQDTQKQKRMTNKTILPTEQNDLILSMFLNDNLRVAKEKKYLKTILSDLDIEVIA